MPRLTKEQTELTNAARGRPGPVRVGWYWQRGEPHHIVGCRYYPQASGIRSHGFLDRAAAEAAGHPPASCCANRHIVASRPDGTWGSVLRRVDAPGQAKAEVHLRDAQVAEIRRLLKEMPWLGSVQDFVDHAVADKIFLARAALSREAS